MIKAKSKREEKIQNKVRYLLTKIGEHCWYCGQPIGDSSLSETRLDSLHLEHIQPKSKFKNEELDNLALACGACNRAKLNEDIVDFLKWLSHIRSSRFNCFILGKLDKIQIDQLTPECWDKLRKDFFGE